MPVAFVNHGAGPWPFANLGVSKSEAAHLTSSLQTLAKAPKVTPKALLVISAHWEESIPTVNSSAQPPMLYDYYGKPSAHHLWKLFISLITVQAAALWQLLMHVGCPVRKHCSPDHAVAKLIIC